MPTINVMNADAIKLALQNYGDATNFVQILQENHLDDWHINPPIIAKTLVENLAGDTVIVLVPTNDIEIGSLVYCDGLNTFTYVVNVENIFQTPSGIPFFSGFADFIDFHLLGQVPRRILPGQGIQISTNVTIANGLDNFLLEGSDVTFAVGAPTSITIPTAPASGRGVPT